MKGFSPWETIARFFQNNATIEKFICEDQSPRDFSVCTKALRENSRKKFKIFQLVRSVIKEKLITEIPALLQTGKFTDLILQKCVYVDLSRRFFHLMDRAPAYTLDVVKISERIQGIEFTTSLRFLTIKKLDVSQTGVGIDIILNFLSLQNGSGILGVDVSGVPAKRPLRLFTFPDNFQTFIGRMLLFGEGNLQKLMRMFVGKKCNLDLSFAVTSQGQWTALFNELHALKTSKIKTLGWAHNPVSLKFLDFLDCCEDLRDLNLSGCVPPQSRILDAVAEFLENSNIEVFVIAGTPKSKLTGSDLMKIVRVLRVNKVLVNLDVRKNECDVGSMGEIGEILGGNLGLRKFKFSPPNLESSEMTGFWEMIEKREARLTVTAGKIKRKVGKGGGGGESRNRRSGPRPKRIAIGTKEENVDDFWGILQPEVPEIDDSEIIERAMQKYSIDALVSQLQRKKVE
jgi:hypothetical protein